MTAILQQRKVPLIDLAALHAPLRDQIITEMLRVIDSQKFIMGEDTFELEQWIAEYSGTRFAIGCASGTDALFLALLAVGVLPGDRVLTTPYTFFATAGAITRAGATPIFADIDPVTYNLDPIAAKHVLESGPFVKALIPVHLFGGCADMDPLLETTRRYGCAVIEDGAQAIGAEYKARKAQSMGLAACLSFFPSKNLGAFGDGGMVLTSDQDLARKLNSLRLHGTTRPYYHESVGINSRLDSLQAAVLKVKFASLDPWTLKRQRNAALYRELLADNSLPVTPPIPASFQSRHVYNQFVIRAGRRDQLRVWLHENGVGTEIYYPVPLHLQPCYHELGYREGDFPEAERAARETLALPIHSALAPEDVEYIARLISSFYECAA
jgi:dTDP-4-amino-4,6-dideoxygalactose transaminase